MKIITKSILKSKSNTSMRIQVPPCYMRNAGIEIGDKITIRPNIHGKFLIQKLVGEVNKNLINSQINRCNDFHFPHKLMHKHRITENHRVKFTYNEGKLVFSFDKPEST